MPSDTDPDTGSESDTGSGSDPESNADQGSDRDRESVPDRGASVDRQDAPLVRRIQLGNTVFEGQNDVYVLGDADDLALVDAGIATPEARAELQSGLAEFGLDLAAVDDVVLTHWHADHAGLAGVIQAESGATVRVHAADADLVAGAESAWADYRDREARRFAEWRLPRAARAELRSFLDAHADARGPGAAVTEFADGDRLHVGGTTLEVVHLPGHAAGLCALELATDAGTEAFVGDAVLPRYTPNVGGADLRVEAPLRRYVESLERVVAADWRRAWPGHRDVIEAPAERARAILDHHRQRTARVVDVLATHGPCDVWTVSAHLFGDLSDVHILHGPGEAWAHLDHLDAAGAVARDGHEYRLVDPDVSPAALFPDP